MTDKKNIIRHISSSTLLKSIEPLSVKKLVDAGEIVTFEEGDLIIKEDEISPHIFFIVSGTVNIDVKGKDKDIYICSMGSGEFIGEAGIFMTLKRTANVRAAASSVLLKIGRENFHAFIKEKPAAGIKVLLIIIYSMLKKLSVTNQELAFERQHDIEQEDVDEIIKNFIL
ncbi:MAG: cyclic nucleotide-binding domain-containing protein [Spirochaetia bacterium]|jgi:CRP-like cAMP-binding protein|nr:cyclic nucleotide-binding domain-containing protein [Spirochaetia bacterium]